MHWVTSSLDPDTLTDRSVEPGTRTLKIRGGAGRGDMLVTQVDNEAGIWPKGDIRDYFVREM